MLKVIFVFEFISYLSNCFVILYYDKFFELLYVKKIYIIL